MAKFTGTWKHDNFVGTASDDIFDSIKGGDSVDGGAGSDTISIDLSYTDIAVNYNAVAAATTVGTEPLWYMSVKNVEHLDTLQTGGGDDTLTISAAQGGYTWHAGGGADTLKLDFSNAATGMTTTITADGYVTRATPGTDPVLGLATDIERVQIIGSQYGDNLTGMAGNDVLNGGGGDDFLWNVGGKDVIDGGAGYDRVILNYSSATTDVIYDAISAASATGVTIADGTIVRNAETFDLTTNAGNDTVTVSTMQKDFLWIANGGNDHLCADYSQSSAGITVSWLANTPVGPDLRIVTAEMALHMNANAYNIERLDITGSKFNDSIQGTSGNDNLNGGAGSDVMAGGDGNDTYWVADRGDVVTELAAQGTDTVMTWIDYNLGADVENLIICGTSSINSHGNDLANTLTGNEANNTLTGEAGNDILDGKAGADTMIGGLGNDTYYVDNVMDIVRESNGEGTDLIISTVTYSLVGTFVENLQLSSSSGWNATGNSLNNTLTGNGLDNILNGGSGADIMIGGGGNDRYIVDNIGDVVKELSGQGDDEIVASVSYSMAGGFVENLYLSGTVNINGTGNALNNIIHGNDGNNVLDGGGGHDTLIGGQGADTFLFGSASGADTVYDFSAAQGDKINVNAYTHGTAFGGAVTITSDGLGNTVIYLGNGNIVTVTQASVSDVTAHMVW